MILIDELFKFTFIEIEFAIALVAALLLIVFRKRIKRKKNQAFTENDETHWI